MKKFREFLEEAFTMTGSERTDNATVHGRKVGTTKGGHHIIAAQQTHNHFTNNTQRHVTYVVDAKNKLIASHRARDEAGQKKAIAHAKASDKFWDQQDRDNPEKNWNSHHHDNITLTKGK